jgi:hypothetical protein
LNWDDAEMDERIQFTKLGLPYAEAYHTVDFWGESYRRIEGSVLERSSIPGHGVRLEAIRPVGETPLWLGDTLHISQGLAVQEWNLETNQLSSVLDLGRSAQGSVWLALPSEPISIKLDGDSIDHRCCSPNVYVCDLVLDARSRLDIFWGE